MRELFFHILNGAAVRIGGAIKRIGSAPGAKYSYLFAYYSVHRFVKVFGRERRRVWIHKSIISYSLYFVFFSSEMVVQFFLDT